MKGSDLHAPPHQLIVTPACQLLGVFIVIQGSPDVNITPTTTILTTDQDKGLMSLAEAAEEWGHVKSHVHYVST